MLTIKIIEIVLVSNISLNKFTVGTKVEFNIDYSHSKILEI